MLYAVIKTGGKQYRVSIGDIIHVEKLALEDGATVEFEPLMLSDESGVRVGTPSVAGAKVVAKVVRQVKGKKIIVFKYKSKKDYRKKQGHRQPYTQLEIVSING